MKSKIFVAALISLISLTALADRMALPADAPAAFKNECGACHLAFPPSLLTAPDWRRVMNGLEKHYGDNAAVDDPTFVAIWDFLRRYAGDARHAGDAGDPPRITATYRFVKKHREITRAQWQDPAVKTPANCAACHTRAEAGSFSEREVVMPGGQRRTQ